MTQLMRGADQILQQIMAELEDITDATEQADRKAITNPHYVKDRNIEIRQAVSRITAVLNGPLRDKLQRAAPSYDKRLASLEAQVAELTKASNIRVVSRAAGE